MNFIIVSLAVWRISHMMVKEAGPLMVFARLRAFLATHQKRSGGLFDLISCVYCFSVWTGLVAALFTSHGLFSWLAYGLAYAGVSSILEHFLADSSNSFSVVTRPTSNHKVAVGVSSAPKKGNNVVGNPDAPNGYMTVETPSSLND